jgi:CheY-like chemotaxis protein
MRHEPEGSHARRKHTRTRRILVVDDNPDFRSAVTVVMQRLGYSVETATSGPEALQTMRSRVPDAVVIDLLMPNTRGRSDREPRRSHSINTRVSFLSGARNGTAVAKQPGARANQPEHGGLTALMATVDLLLSGATNRP